MVSEYRDFKVLVTGGLGFIGSNLALRLAALGADVAVVDSSAPGCGANPLNLQGSASKIHVIDADIGDAPAFASDIRSSQVIFNLAGEISHLQSMRQPSRDQDLNATSQLRFLEECARQNPGVRVVYASTRQIYGVPRYLPVDEGHPIQPVDFNGIHKYAATAYHQVFTSAGKLDAVSLCLTNVYGPRMALDQASQGFLGGFLRKALLGQAIEVFGDGRQLRDPVYVDDVVDALLLAGATRNLRSRLWNVGGGEALPIAELARIIASAARAPIPFFSPFPEELKSIDIGSYHSDSSLIGAQLGWRPRVAFARGVRLSLKFYRRESADYRNGVGYEPAARDEWSTARPQPLAV
jgi:nucleoside-diphosphate-sugar epimerase